MKWNRLTVPFNNGEDTITLYLSEQRLTTFRQPRDEGRGFLSCERRKFSSNYRRSSEVQAEYAKTKSSRKRVQLLESMLFYPPFADEVTGKKIFIQTEHGFIDWVFEKLLYEVNEHKVFPNFVREFRNERPTRYDMVYVGMFLDMLGNNKEVCEAYLKKTYANINSNINSTPEKSLDDPISDFRGIPKRHQDHFTLLGRALYLTDNLSENPALGLAQRKLRKERKPRVQNARLTISNEKASKLHKLLLEYPTFISPIDVSDFRDHFDKEATTPEKKINWIKEVTTMTYLLRSLKKAGIMQVKGHLSQAWSGHFTVNGNPLPKDVRKRNSIGNVKQSHKIDQIIKKIL